MRPEGFNYLPEAWRAYIAGLESVRSEALAKLLADIRQDLTSVADSPRAEVMIQRIDATLSPARVAEGGE